MESLTAKDVVYRRWVDSKSGNGAAVDPFEMAQRHFVKECTVRQWIGWWEQAEEGEPYIDKDGRNMSLPPKLSRDYTAVLSSMSPKRRASK